MSISITIKSPAKVNLSLSVGPPEPAETPDGGMHPIASWMAAIDLFDELTLEAAEETTLQVQWADDAPMAKPIGWLQSDDLAVRALAAIGDAAGKELNANISLTKRIPVGGGLGGGSSDAAACLFAANSLFELGLPVEQLAQIGKALGSDIPFFIDDNKLPRPALVMRFGELVRRVQLDSTQLLLIVPNFGCHTADVYKEYDQSPLTLDADRVIEMAQQGRVVDYELFNDLSLPAQRSQPELGSLISRVQRLTDLPIHVSGSGSSLFIVADSADTLAEEIQTRVPNVRCLMTRTLTGAENR
jgi:4-diphosphocytidyl-2-C-methyl-D-erythritol kinase